MISADQNREAGETRRSAVAISLLFIAAELAVSLATSFLFPDFVGPRSLHALTASYAMMATLLFVLFALYERLRGSFVLVTALATILSVAAGLVHIAAFRIAFARLENGSLALDSLFISAGQMIHFYFAWSATMLALIYSRRRRSEQQRRTAAERAAHGAQMRAVRYQLNPHFLFNTLNSIGALIGERRESEAEGLIRGLSDYLRTGLKIDPMSDQTLDEEFAQQAAYLAIELVRFPDRLETRFDLPDELASALVPPFVLNPLVEDAVRHGVAPSRGRTRLTLSAARGEPGRLELQLLESHAEPPSSLERERMDLLETRLRQRVGHEFAIKTTLDEDRARRTSIHLPLIFASQTSLPAARNGE